MSGFAGMNSLDSGLSSAGMLSRLDNPAKQPDSVHSGVHRIAGQDGHTGPAGRPGIGQSLGDGAAGVLMGGQRVDGLLGKDVEVADAHAHELDRLDVLMSQNLIDTPPAQDIDAYARIATRTFGTMYAMVSLVRRHMTARLRAIVLSCPPYLPSPDLHSGCSSLDTILIFFCRWTGNGSGSSLGLVVQKV